MPPHPSALRTANVNPSDAADLPERADRLYVGVAGDVSVQVVGDNPGDFRLFKGVPAGTDLAVAVSRVRVTGTTAGSIVAILHDKP